MPTRASLYAVGAVLAAGAGLVAAGPAVAAPPSPVVGHTYVDDNPAGPNTIAGFDRHADGSLTPMRGSPFPAGGTGLGSGLGSQGALQVSPDGHYLLAVDAGSDQISVLRLGPAGRPTPVGPPVSSGGVEPVSIAIDPHGLVYVANVGAGGSNYAGFRLGPQGRLAALPGSTVAVPEGSGVGDVLFNSTGDRLVGARDDTSLIDSFWVRPDGRLVPAAGSPYPAQSLGPIGSQFRPTNPAQLFVTNAHAGAGNGTVSSFHVSQRGVLAPFGPSPFADGQTAPCWVEISHDGKYLFAVNTGSATISRFLIHGGSLTLLGSTPITNGAGSTDARLSPDGSTLSVVGSGGLAVHTFAVDGGSLTELASAAALPVGTSPVGIVVQ